jgi:hypothetical protein
MSPLPSQPSKAAQPAAGGGLQKQPPAVVGRPRDSFQAYLDDKVQGFTPQVAPLGKGVAADAKFKPQALPEVKKNHLVVKQFAQALKEMDKVMAGICDIRKQSCEHIISLHAAQASDEFSAAGLERLTLKVAEVSKVAGKLHTQSEASVEQTEALMGTLRVSTRMGHILERRVEKRKSNPEASRNQPLDRYRSGLQTSIEKRYSTLFGEVEEVEHELRVERDAYRDVRSSLAQEAQFYHTPHAGHRAASSTAPNFEALCGLINQHSGAIERLERTARNQEAALKAHSGDDGVEPRGTTGAQLAGRLVTVPRAGSDRRSGVPVVNERVEQLALMVEDMLVAMQRDRSPEPVRQMHAAFPRDKKLPTDLGRGAAQHYSDVDAMGVKRLFATGRERKERVESDRKARGMLPLSPGGMLDRYAIRPEEQKKRSEMLRFDANSMGKDVIAKIKAAKIEIPYTQVKFVDQKKAVSFKIQDQKPVQSAQSILASRKAAVPAPIAAAKPPAAAKGFKQAAPLQKVPEAKKKGFAQAAAVPKKGFGQAAAPKKGFAQAAATPKKGFKQAGNSSPQPQPPAVNKFAQAAAKNKQGGNSSFGKSLAAKQPQAVNTKQGGQQGFAKGMLASMSGMGGGAQKPSGSFGGAQKPNGFAKAAQQQAQQKSFAQQQQASRFGQGSQQQQQQQGGGMGAPQTQTGARFGSGQRKSNFSNIQPMHSQQRPQQQQQQRATGGGFANRAASGGGGFSQFNKGGGGGGFSKFAQGGQQGGGFGQQQQQQQGGFGQQQGGGFATPPRGGGGFGQTQNRFSVHR